MFDIGFSELALIGVIGLVVLGPQQLTSTIRTTSKLAKKVKSTFDSVKTELIKEAELQELKQKMEIVERKSTQGVVLKDNLLAESKTALTQTLSEINSSMHS